MDYWVIYIVTCLYNKKQYIGITQRDIEVRWKGHKRNGFALCNAIKKYGESAFIIEILEQGLIEQKAKILEIEFIASYVTQSPYGYNITAGGGGVRKLSEEIELKRRQKLKDNFLKEEHIDKQRQIALEQWADPTFKAKMKVGLQKRWDDPEIKERMLEGIKKRKWKINPWKDPEKRARILAGRRK